MRALLDIVLIILDIATFVIIAQAILSWLVSFGVLNLQNGMVRQIWYGLQTLTEPVYRPIRNILPSAGGLDFTPIVVILGIIFLERVIMLYLYPNVF